MNEGIYLDYAATTPLDPRARAAVDAAGALVGNPSSVHRQGREVRAVIDRARANVARLLAVPESEIVFTSGATEANGAALAGVLKAVRKAHPDVTPGIVASGFEHASVSETLETLRADGAARVIRVAPESDGVLSAEAVALAIESQTVAVCVMWANNVLGTVQPVAAIGDAVAAERARRGPGGLPIAFICDAVQAMASLPVSPAVVGADFLTLSSHKMYGPKGVGAMRIAQGAPFAAAVGGGGQEGSRRHGTENVAGIAGFGEAAAILHVERGADSGRTALLRRSLFECVRREAPRALQVGSEAGAGSVPGIVFLRVPGARGDELALRLDAAGFSVSAGSACDAGKRRSPGALAAVLDEQSALAGGIRISFGRFTRDADVSAFAATLGKILRNL